MAECLGPQCASMVLEWLKTYAASSPRDDASALAPPTQGLLWALAPYQDDAPAITSSQELAGAIEHLHYAVFRRYSNQLTRAERSRLDNSIDNALFKIDRYLSRAEASEATRYEGEVRDLRRT
jgi:restriction system protein